MELFIYQLITDINKAEADKDFERHAYLKDKLRFWLRVTDV